MIFIACFDHLTLSMLIKFEFKCFRYDHHVGSDDMEGTDRGHWQ